MSGMIAETSNLIGVVTTDRLRLRPIRDRDARHFAALGRDAEVFRYIPEISAPLNAEAWIEELCRNPECYVRHAVELLGTGTVIGAVQLDRRSNLMLQLGYWYGRPFWGQGYATETVEALLKLLDTLTGEPLHAAVHPDNLASRSVLENNGFVCLNRYLRGLLEYRRAQ